MSDHLNRWPTDTPEDIKSMFAPDGYPCPEGCKDDRHQAWAMQRCTLTLAGRTFTQYWCSRCRQHFFANDTDGWTPEVAACDNPRHAQGIEVDADGLDEDGYLV